MKNVDVLIVGAGAAGLMAAACLRDSSLKVCLVEKKSKAGSKLLLTGKGRCNITNMREWGEFAEHVHPDSKFFKQAFYKFSNKDLVEFLNSMGLETKEERGMRVFPLSDKSIDVRDTLLKAFINKIDIKYETSILNISPVEHSEESPSGFIVGTCKELRDGKKEVENIFTKKVILATGGLSYPLTGSTGDGYNIAQSLGHKIVNTMPSLTALIPQDYDVQLINNTLRNIKLSLEVDGNIVQQEEGELIFTDGGIEGALGFRVSRKAVQALINKSRVHLIIDLKPALALAQLQERVQKEIEIIKGSHDVKSLTKEKILFSVLRTMLPKNIINPFIKHNKLIIEKLPSKLKEWRFVITDYVGYQRAVVTAGGVSLDEISRKTMESKLIPGLYFAGEIMNLDADTGGYNLQIAFSTAFLAAKSAEESLKSVE